MAKKAQPSLTHRDIIKAVQQKQFAPVYLLMGEESYYIDRISEYLADNILPETERDFNQQTIYCTKETDVMDIINAARRYPMMSSYQVLIVKEAQNLLKIDELQHYLKSPLNTTILVICYKHGTVDKRKAFLKMISDCGVVYESPKLKEYQLPQFIDEYVRRKKVAIDERAKNMLVANIGADLSRMSGELDKLFTTLPPGFNMITPELVEKNIGISKEFNNWEFRSAIINRDIAKANLILNFFNANPKANPPISIVAILFGYFASLMQAFYSPDKSEQGLMQHLELRSSFQLKDFLNGMRNFSAMKTMQIIGKLRETDAKLKGVGKGNTSDEDIMKELVYFILH